MLSRVKIWCSQAESEQWDVGIDVRRRKTGFLANRPPHWFDVLVGPAKL